MAPCARLGTGVVQGAQQHPAAPGTKSTFFFQAADGIRDVAVTGVQTCALPISEGAESRCKRTCQRVTREYFRAAAGRNHVGQRGLFNRKERPDFVTARTEYADRSRDDQEEIGRASCREREQI